jgi:hypothetical protein
LADFVALYRGRTVSEAELVAISAKPQLVERFFAELLGKSKTAQEADDSEHSASFPKVVRDE